MSMKNGSGIILTGETEEVKEKLIPVPLFPP
jgi:hypothetical protein